MPGEYPGQRPAADKCFVFPGHYGFSAGLRVRERP